MSEDDRAFLPKGGSMQAHAVNGAVALALAQLFKIPFQAASLLLLPRLLQPEDYGVYAMVDPILSILILLVDLGIGSAVIQAQSLTRAQVAGLFWVQVVLGLLGAAMLVAASPLIADFFHTPQVGPLAAASALILVFYGFSMMPESLMNRQMMFGRLAIISAIGVSVGLFVGVIAAEAGLGYWALTLDFGATCLTNLIGVWICCGWFPKERPDFKSLLRFFRFGGSIVLSDTGSLISRQADSVLVGRFAGATQLGFYDRGTKLALIPLQRTNQIFQQVLLPILSRMAESAERYRSAYLRIIRQLMLFFVPGVVGVGVTAPVLVPFLIGDQWTASAPILAWLTLAALHRPVSLTMNLLFVSQGRGKDYMIWSLFSMVTSVLAFVVGLRWGALGVAAAFGLSDLLIRMPFLWFWVTRKGPIKMTDLYGAALPFAAGAAAAFVVVSLVQGIPFPNDFMQLAVSAVVSYMAAWSTVALFKSGRGAMADTLYLVKREGPRFLKMFKPRGAKGGEVSSAPAE